VAGGATTLNAEGLAEMPTEIEMYSVGRRVVGAPALKLLNY